MSNNSTFDDDEMIQILIKKSFQVPATYEQTKWFNEAKGVSRTILEASDINSKTVPTTPIWGDASLNESDLDSYGIKLDPTQNFAASPYDEIHTFADATYLSYSKTISIDPGAYIDYTGTVMLFVKLKLDRMDAPSASAIAYTKYHIDSSQNSILDNAYQFNYNQQRNVLDSSGNFISLFKPYAYYLELSTDGGYNCDLLSPDHGNWFFDFKSGIITFSDDPNDSSFGADAKDVTNGDLYFTFVKYVGPRGLDKLISVDDDFDSTATSGFYKNQIVVDSSNSEIYLMKDGSWNSIGGGGGGGSETVNLAGQTFHEVVTGAPQAFTKGGISNTLFTIDISWNFDDIQPSESNRLFNFPLPNKRDRVIPYMSHIYFDISSSTSDISFSENIEIDSSHNYAEDSKTVSGHIESSGGDLSYNLTYRTLTLTKFSEDTRTYTVNVWGVNESNESSVYKLPFVDISFVSDSEAIFTGDTDFTTRTNHDVSGTITAVDSDVNDNGKDVSFGIHNDVSYGSLTITQTDNTLNWTYNPNADFSGNDTFTIRTYSKIGGIIIDSNNGYTGFTSDISINILVDDPAEFTGDLSVNTNVGEDTSGVVYIRDPNGNITYDISNDITHGGLSYTSTPPDAHSSQASDISINWIYTADSFFTGEESFTIITTDVNGGISSQQILIKIPYIYEINDHVSLDTSMLSVHDNLIAVGTSISVKPESNRYDLSGNQSDDGYQFDIYKVDETSVSEEYLPSNMTTYGLAGINLSYIMDKVFADYSDDGGEDLSYVESDFYSSLSNPSYDDDNIIVYIVATNKSTGEPFMARINKDLPGFDEMNPWYLTNKVNEDSTLNGLSSGLGSGALPSSELQTDISNNSISDYFDTAQINGHDPIIIHINSNAFENHYFYFATKL